MIRMKENWKANAKVTWAYFRNVSSRPISVYKEKDSLKTGLGKPRQPAPPWPLIYKLPRVAADLAEYMKQIPNRRAGVCECRRCDARLKSSKFASPSENILQLRAPRAVLQCVERITGWGGWRLKSKLICKAIELDQGPIVHYLLRVSITSLSSCLIHNIRRRPL